MATAGVAAVAALEVVSRGEDHVRTFVIKILGAKLVALALYFLFSRCVFVEFDWLRHRCALGTSRLFPFYSFPVRAALPGTPLPPIARR